MPTSGEGRTYYDENVDCRQCGLYQTVTVIYDIDDNTRWWECTYCNHQHITDLF